MNDPQVSRRRFLEGSATLAAGLLLPALPRRASGEEPRGGGAEDQRPNVIVMMVDDLGFSDLGCFGSEIRTPNLDALAANGVRGVNFQNTSRCCPSRACILSGLYPHQTGVGYFAGAPSGPMAEYPGYQGRMCHPCVTMAEVLKTAGYATFGGGKWHVGEDPRTRLGFDEAIDLPTMNYFLKEEPSEACYSTEVLGDWITARIDKYGRQSKPFFAYYTPIAPHFPIQGLSRDAARYKGAYNAGPRATAEARLARMRAMGLIDPAMPVHLPGAFDQQGRDDYLSKARCSTELDGIRQPLTKDGAPKNKVVARPVAYVEEAMEIYAGMVECLDRNVGKVVAKLKELGIFDNTLFLFCSDNGCSAETDALRYPWTNVCNTPFRGSKIDSWFGGTATPLLLHWPQRLAPTARNSINRTWGHLIDVMPTVLAATGCTYPAQDHAGRPVPPMEGRSLLPLLEGQTLPLEKPIFIEHFGNCALITEDWKLREGGESNNEPWELYDLRRDRFETQDLAAQHPERVAAMETEWNAIAARIGARREGRPRKPR